MKSILYRVFIASWFFFFAGYFARLEIGFEGLFVILEILFIVAGQVVIVRRVIGLARCESDCFF